MARKLTAKENTLRLFMQVQHGSEIIVYVVGDSSVGILLNVVVDGASKNFFGL
jgi:hypothetical protein